MSDLSTKHQRQHYSEHSQMYIVAPSSIFYCATLSAPVMGDSAGKGTNLSLFLVIMRGKYFYVHLHKGIETMKNLLNGVSIY